MLAQSPLAKVSVGALSAGVIPPSTFARELLAFIAQQLPEWRDDPSRPRVSSERVLTDQLSKHLNRAARSSETWDILQFGTETPDEVRGRRSIDLTGSPAVRELWVYGRKYVTYETILPIECKRLPTPSGTLRDPREYVFDQHKSGGGIQRFKEGEHGAAHTYAGMIAYVQDGSCGSWFDQVKAWISDLATARQTGWSTADSLTLVASDAKSGVAICDSVHSRTGPLPHVELRHLWIEMKGNVKPGERNRKSSSRTKRRST